MTFDPRSALTLPQCAARMRGRGRDRPHYESLRRWATVGRKLPDGSVVKLRSVRLGGQRLVAPGWLDAFMDACVRGGEAAA